MVGRFDGVSDLEWRLFEDIFPPAPPKREEIGFLDRYLEIERTRFGERLKIVKAIEEARGYKRLIDDGYAIAGITTSQPFF